MGEQKREQQIIRRLDSIARAAFRAGKERQARRGYVFAATKGCCLADVGSASRKPTGGVGFRGQISVDAQRAEVAEDCQPLMTAQRSC